MSAEGWRRLVIACWAVSMTLIAASTILYFLTGRAYPGIVIPCLISVTAAVLYLRRTPR